MNIDVLTWFEYFIGAFACCFGIFISGKILLKRKFKEISYYSYILVLILSIFMVFNSLVFDNIIKLFGNLFIVFIIYKIIYKEKNTRAFIYSIIVYLLFPISEIIFIFSVSFIDYIFNFSITETITKAAYSNIVIGVLVCLNCSLLKKKINHYVGKISQANILIIFLQGLLTLFILLSSLNNLYIEKFHFSYKLILNTVIILGSTILTFALLRQYLKNKEINDKYELLNEYMRTSAEIIEKYSSTIHKYKNNLITIKGYMKSDMKEANNYVDSLLDNFKNKKYSWFSKINNISIDTIRYLIYYKLSKSEELNLKISVNVSNDVKKIDSNILNSQELGNILEILGEYFDNANYASNESDEKELNFYLYLQDNNMVFVIANTYKEKMELNLITKNGYTTKGKGHGFGLYDVEKTIKNMNFLTNKYEKIDNYFVVTFTINLTELKK